MTQLSYCLTSDKSITAITDISFIKDQIRAE